MAKQAQKILRVGIIQGGKIIEERLLRKMEAVTIGWSPKNTLVVPASNLPRSFTLFGIRGGSYTLNFMQGAKGRVLLDGGVAQLGSLASSGKARKKGSEYQIDLNEKARGKVALGDVTLLFQFVTPPPLPPKLKLPASARGGWVKSIEWHFLAMCVVSAVIQAVPLLWVVMQDWPVPKRTEMIPDRFVTLIMKEPIRPTETPEDEPELSDEGEGKEEEKEKPKEKAPKKVAKATSSKAQDPEAAARAAAQRKRALAKAVRGRTLLRFITSRAADGEEGTAGLVDSLSQGAARSKVDAAFAGATGVTTASAGMERSLRGGVATDTGGSVAGIGDLGGGAGARKTVKSAGTRKERRVKAAIKMTGPSTTFGTGKMDRNDIARVVRGRIRAVKSCYERELKKDPTLKGKIVMQFTIGEMGRVTSSKVASSTMPSPAVGRCILGRIRRWRFPKPTGGSVTVSYPFVFTASG